MTHSSPPGLRSSPAWMRDSATFTTVTSSWIMNVARHMTSSVSRRCFMKNYLLVIPYCVDGCGSAKGTRSG